MKVSGLIAMALLLAAAAFVAGSALPGEGGAETPAGAEVLLSAQSYWRWHVTCRKPMVREAGGQEVPLARKGQPQPEDPDSVEIPAPPDGWTGPDFDDSAWPRSRLAWIQPLAFGRFSTARVSLRGRFAVTDPAKAELYVSSRHVGGLVVYLNGKEACRADMPAGEIAADTLASPYDDKVYLNEGGKPHTKYLPKWAINPEPIRLRTRRLESVKLPAGLARKGVNVLAVEVRRSPYASAAAKWFMAHGIADGAPQWPHAELSEFQLSCVGGGATPNVARPAGVQVWNQDRNDRVTAGDYGDPHEPLRPVRIVGAKNGSFCGQVVVSSDAAIAGAKAVPGELKGPGAIPAASVTVLYGRMDWPNRMAGKWSDSLQEQPIAEVPVDKDSKAAALPLLFRVRVPADAAPGTYNGNVSVTAGGKPVAVPVQLEVADWKVPDPRDYRTYMGVYQSPTSVALQYKVEMWSEEHWKLVEKSIAMLSRVGNRMVNIPVVEQTQFGNDRGFVTWIRKADGSYDHDLSVLERYVKLALKHWGGLDYVTLQIWHAAGGGGKGGWDTRPADTKCTVTVRDEKTGQYESVQVPVFGSEDSRKFWRPVLAKIQESLRKLGAEKGMCVGILSDSTAPKEVFEMFNDVFPGGKGAFWHRGCHGGTGSPVPYQVPGMPASNKVILHEHCYGMSMVGPETPELPPIHTYRGWPGTAYFRIVNHESTETLLSSRTMAERGLFCQKQGIGRICLDFWPVFGEKQGWANSLDIYNRWPHSTCAQRRPSLRKLTWPGPEGAETTMRYEALVEGVQEAEALILVSEGAAGGDKVGRELADRCRAAMRDHLWFCHTRNQVSEHYTVVHVNHYGWQELTGRTFRLAGEVARARGGK